MRLWESAIFVLAHPADWGPVETAQLREGLEQANLLPRGFKVGRLVSGRGPRRSLLALALRSTRCDANPARLPMQIFVKEPTAIVYFARRHTRDADSTWLQVRTSRSPSAIAVSRFGADPSLCNSQEGTSFALCDAADHGTSIIGFTVSSLTPKLKLRAYETVSRLPFGAASVRSAFSALLVKRLAKSKLGKQPAVLQAIMDEFDSKVKTRFSGAADSVEGFRLRFASEGEDKSAGASGGCMMFTGCVIWLALLV